MELLKTTSINRSLAQLLQEANRDLLNILFMLMLDLGVHFSPQIHYVCPAEDAAVVPK